MRCGRFSRFGGVGGGGGDGGGGDTGPDSAVINFDLTTSAGVTASGLTTTRTGTGLYCQTDESTVTLIGNNTPVFEDYGADDQDPGAGGGVWSFDTVTPTFSSFDFSTGYTTDASVGYTANSENGPNGALTADKIDDTQAGSRQAVYRAIAALGMCTVFHKEATGDAPTADGCLASDNTPTAFTSLGTRATWKKTTHEAAASGNYTVIPAGGSDQSATGAIVAWGGEYQATRFPLPVSDAANAKGICTNTVPVTSFLNGGVIDVEISARMTNHQAAYFATSATPYWWFRALDQLGREWSLRWGRDANSIDRCWIARCAGLDVSTASLAASEWPKTMAWHSGDEVTVRFYLSSTVARIRVTVNGCVCLDHSGVVQVAVAPSSLASIYIGSDGTTANRCAKVRYSSLKSYDSHRDWDMLPEVQGVILGDSTAGLTTDFGAIGTRVVTISEARAGYRIANLATTGNTIAQQTTKWQACGYRGDARVQWVAIFHTVNDISAGTAAATITGNLQTLVNDVAAQNPTAKIFVFAPQPCDGWSLMSAGDQAIWITCYQNVAGTGPNPITGATVVNTAVSDALNTGGTLGIAGANTLLATYDRTAAFGRLDGIASGSAAGGGDHVHADWRARALAGAALRVILDAESVGP